MLLFTEERILGQWFISADLGVPVDGHAHCICDLTKEEFTNSFSLNTHTKSQILCRKRD